METGATGPRGPVDHEFLMSIIAGPSGLTGADEYLRTVAIGWTGYEPVDVTGPVGVTECPPPTVEELEAEDIAALAILSSPPDLSQWHAAGSPDSFVLYDIPLNAPCECCDGQSRNCAKYVEYILNQDLRTLIQSMAATMPGTSFSWSSVGGSFRLHVSKAS
jgi:hypothetical protein